MDISIKFQILAIGILIVIMVDFLCSKKLPLISTKTFTLFWAASFFNLLADIGSYYTITHIDSVPEWLNRLMHQLFLGSLNAMVFLLFMYVWFLCGAQKRISKPVLLGCTVPFIIAIGFAIFGKIDYNVDDRGAYSSGPMVTAFYISVAVYIVAIIVLLCTRDKRYDHENSEILPDFKRARVSILVGLCIWVAIALVQFFTTYWLLSAMGNSLMVLYVYMRFENPREYMDSETDTLNRRAFHIMMREMFARNKTFYIFNLTLDEVESIQKAMGYDMPKEILRQATAKISRDFPHIRIYHSRSCTITMLVYDRDTLDKIIACTENWDFRCDTASADSAFSPYYHFNIIECPKYAQTADEAYETLDYCLNDRTMSENGKIYFVSDELVEKRNYRKAVLAILTEAVRTKAFNVVYQPIYSAKKRRFASAEALVRLQDTTTVGFISPEYFIPLAEEQGLISEIGNIVFEKVCEFAAREKLWQLGIDYVEVNLSGVQSVDIGIVAQLSKIMTKYGVHPGFFNLEITETASIDGGDMLQYNMEQFRKLGCHFSMDDFGTGYSNLSQMAKVHFELIKLDKSLIWPCFGDDPTEPRIILNSCIDMILQLGVNIVAEGVETAEQAEMLINKGVVYLQGYYFCRPVPESDFVKAVKEKLAQQNVNA